MQISIPLTRAALSNRQFPCVTLLDLPSLCLFAVNKFGSPWNFSSNWLKTVSKQSVAYTCMLENEDLRLGFSLVYMNIFTHQFDLLFKNEEFLPPLMEFAPKEFSDLYIPVNGKHLWDLPNIDVVKKKINNFLLYGNWFSRQQKGE